jgi:hypothetical protein
VTLLNPSPLQTRSRWPSKITIFIFALALVLLPLFSAEISGLFYQTALLAHQESMRSTASSPTDKKLILDNLPLYFVANQGQTDQAVSFYIQGRDKTIYFSPQGITYALESSPNANLPALSIGEEGSLNLPAVGESHDPQPPQRWAVKLDFVNANPDVNPMGEFPTQAAVSYFKGQPDQWYTHLPTYSQIRYPDLWQGIDLVFSGRASSLKYEFIVQPGADPSQIQLAYRGASDVRLTQAGQLEIRTPLGGFHDAVPLAFQERDGQRLPVEMGYALTIVEKDGDQPHYQYGFALGEYDAALPLVLDPEVLVYAGYIGGSDQDESSGIAVDTQGNAYITGSTTSSETSFPVLAGPDLTFHFGGQYVRDAFVVKVNPSGTALVYAGYIGGSGEDRSSSIAVDIQGNAYITGYTSSSETSFPVLVGPDLAINGQTDAFVVKVHPSGTNLVYSGYIGGDRPDGGFSIAVDASGNAYITGMTESTQSSFPVLAGPDLTHNGGWDAFVAKVNPSGTALVYAGYIGGDETDQGNSIAVDSNGNAYLTGSTTSGQATFPVLVGPDLTFNSDLMYGLYFVEDAFVAKVNSAGTALVYAGYIGGTSSDQGHSIAVDLDGYAYITGTTQSTKWSFPVRVGPDLTYDDDSQFSSQAFVAKVDVAGAELVYSGYIGEGEGTDIAVDSEGYAYITGRTASPESDFPVLGGPDLTYNGHFDAFIAKIYPDGRNLVFSTYIGGKDRDEGISIAVDAIGNVYATGNTGSDPSTFPVLNGPDLTYNGSMDVFIAKLAQTNPGPVDLAVSRVEIIQAITVSDPNAVYIAGKPALLRAYISLEGADWQAHLTGRLTRYVNGVAQASLDSSPTTISSNIQEDGSLITLNFYLNSEWVAPGKVEYVLDLDPENIIPETDESNNRYPASGVHSFTFVATPVLDIVIVPVTYARPGAAITQPPLEDLTYLTWMLEQVYPISQVNYTVRSLPYTFTRDLRSSGAWSHLLNEITTIHEYEDPNQSKIYYGLIDFYSVDGCADICTGGLAWINDPSRRIRKTAVGFTGFTKHPHMAGETLAHEIGHVYGRYHTPGINYPYGGSGKPSIGKWGYHTAFDEFLSPSVYIDYMYYLSDSTQKQWTSDYTYNQIYQAFRWVDGWALDAANSLYLPYVNKIGLQRSNFVGSTGITLSLNGIIAPNGSLEIEPLFLTAGQYVPSEEDSPYHAVLLDEAGRQLASHPLALTQIAFEEMEDDYIGYGFRESLPLVEGLSGLQIFKEGLLVFERYRRFSAPTQEGISQEQDSDGDLRLAWMNGNGPFAAGASSLAYRVLFSPDGGVSWNVLAANTNQPSLVVPAQLFKNATRPELRIQVSDGVQTHEQLFVLNTNR